MSTIAERNNRRRRYSQTGTLDDRRFYLLAAAGELERNREQIAQDQDRLDLAKTCSKAVAEVSRTRQCLRELQSRYDESARLAPFYVRVSEVDSARRSRLYNLSVTFSLDEIAMQLYRGSREGYVDRELRAIVRDVEHKVYRVLADKLREALGVPKGGPR